MLELIHGAVPGRARLRARGLNYSNGFKTGVEQVLGQTEGIISVTASSITGSVLVKFDPARDLASIARTVESAVSRYAQQIHQEGEAVAAKTNGDPGPAAQPAVHAPIDARPQGRFRTTLQHI